jgi:DNA-binding MarR family transcriptional regulator
VVSRMVRSLQRLGLVVRRRESEGDRRQMLVALTAAGLETLKNACRLLIKGVQRIVYRVICFGRHRDPWERLLAMETLEDYLRALRKDFGDSATLYYSWGHPDD